MNKLIETGAIIVAYAMSRLDTEFLKRFSFQTWQQAFAKFGKRFAIPPTSMKNLRDEFDPIHPNRRKGWHKRPLRKNRQQIIGEFWDCSDDALTEIVTRLLNRDKEVEELVVVPIATRTSPVGNNAERSRTGRLAEDYFFDNSESICNLPKSDLLDHREEYGGYDFAVRHQDRLVIEVKGMKKEKGAILFSDHEWQLAKVRKADYWLVIVGSIESSPRATLIKNPSAVIKVKASIRQQITVSWAARVKVPV